MYWWLLLFCCVAIIISITRKASNQTFAKYQHGKYELLDNQTKFYQNKMNKTCSSGIRIFEALNKK